MTRRKTTRNGASRRTGRAPARVRSRPPSRRRATARPRTSARKKPTRRPQRRRIARIAWVPAVIVAAVVVMGVYLYPLVRMDYAGQREVSQLETQLESLQDRNDVLRGEVDRLKTPEGVEEAARETLGYVKPGEDAYVVIDPDRSSDPASSVVPVSETVLANEPGAWWEQLLDRLFGVRS